MKQACLSFILISNLMFSQLSFSLCDTLSKPKLIKPIENWEIIAGNMAYIKTAPYFQGNNLIYYLSYDKIKPSNSAVINPQTGELRINAESKDNFNLTVNVQNHCGKVENSFNVQIDEEE